MPTMLRSIAVVASRSRDVLRVLLCDVSADVDGEHHVLSTWGKAFQDVDAHAGGGGGGAGAGAGTGAVCAPGGDVDGVAKPSNNDGARRTSRASVGSGRSEYSLYVQYQQRLGAEVAGVLRRAACLSEGLPPAASSGSLSSAVSFSDALHLAPTAAPHPDGVDARHERLRAERESLLEGLGANLTAQIEPEVAARLAGYGGSSSVDTRTSPTGSSVYRPQSRVAPPSPLRAPQQQPSPHPLGSSPGTTAPSSPTTQGAVATASPRTVGTPVGMPAGTPGYSESSGSPRSRRRSGSSGSMSSRGMLVSPSFYYELVADYYVRTSSK
jgi:hypothetical protein